MSKAVPVFIQSYTGFGLKFEFIQLLYNQIIQLFERRIPGIELDWIRVENYLDKVEITISYMPYQIKYEFPLREYDYRSSWSLEERIRLLIQEMKYDLRQNTAEIEESW